jgi:predicted lipoprotein with Yx(FWY)xxD motif
MKRLALLALVCTIGCHEKSTVIDHGGKSLDIPVPSSGVAATPTGPRKDIFVYPKRAKQDPSSLDVKIGPYGPYIVDAVGRSLYAFSGDAGGQTGCTANCATVWPPVVVKKLPSVKNASIDASKLSMIDRADGTHQLTYAERPLYYAESDLEPGNTWGHYAMGFGGQFTLVAPDGKPVAPPK